MAKGRAPVTVTKAADQVVTPLDDLPEGFWYSVKSRLLGPPLVNEQLSEERLSKPLALGVLSPDGISSSAYGSEEILVELLKGGLGIAAFTLLLPITGVVLMIDYTVTVAVQTAAGADAIVSAFPRLSTLPVVGSHILLLISVVAIVIMAYGNLRGIREAGRAFA